MDIQSLSQIGPLVVCLAVMYFLVMRPQQQKMKKHREALKQLKRGDKVMLSSGIEGTIEDVPGEASVIRVNIAPGTTVNVRRELISEMTSKS
jgi:preprotein translocase subunit YajC